MVGKPGRVITYERTFNMQALKSSLSSCFFFSLFPSHRFFLDRLPKVFLTTFHDLLPRKHVSKNGLISLETLKEASVTNAFQDLICDVCDPCSAICFTLFVITRIHSILKITKIKNLETAWKVIQKIQLFKIQRYHVDN